MSIFSKPDALDLAAALFELSPESPVPDMASCRKSTVADYGDEVSTFDAQFEARVRPAIDGLMEQVRIELDGAAVIERGRAAKQILDRWYIPSTLPLADYAHIWKYAAQAVANDTDEIIEILLRNANFDEELVAKVLRVPVEDVIAVECI